MNSNTRPAVSRYQGFSLIELMIAMVIGLILLAGVGTVFISTQQTSQTKRALDNAQETLRYTHQSISRMVRIGEIDGTSAVNRLVITFDRDEDSNSHGAATPDCLGNPIVQPAQVVYTLIGTDLVCAAGDRTGVVARNITAFSLRYQSLNGNTWSTPPPAGVVSAEVTFEFDELIGTRFVATSRGQVLDAI